MVTFTTNKALGLPTVGGDTGVWGPPLNNNSSVIDASFGGSVSIPLSSVSGSLVLLASDYNNVFLTFTGALSQNTFIAMPAIGSFYTIQNLTTGSSSFQVLLQLAGTQLCLAPGVPQEIMTTAAAGVVLRGLPPVGAYWDYAGSSLPTWVGFTIPAPWLNCDGTSFSSATYPNLANILGGTTLPDSRGRVRAALNQGTNRLNSVITDTVGAGGGDQNLQSHTHANSLNDPTHTHTVGVFNGPGTPGANGIQGTTQGNNTSTPTGQANPSATGMSITNASAGSGGAQNVQPTFMGGICLIRAG